MADYYPLIARAVDGLGASTGEARRSLYERARAALVSQLRSIEPALSEADITRERLALEDAIRKVEAESARKARTERPAPAPRPAAPSLRTPSPTPAPSDAPRTRPAPPPGNIASRPEPPRPEPPRPEPPRSAPPPRTEPPPLRMQGGPVPSDAARPAAQGVQGAQGGQASARSRLLGARTSPISREGLKGFRDVVNEVDDLGTASARSAQSARDTRDSYGATARQQPSDDDDQMAPPHERMEPRFDSGDADVLDDDSPETHALEPSFDLEDEPPAPRPFPPRAREPEERYEQPRPPRSYRGLVKLAIVLLVIAGVAATISWQWSHISGLYQYVSHMRSRQTQTVSAPPTQQKFPGRVPQEQTQTPPPAGSAPSAQNVPAVAQRVVLYEEEPNNPQGRQFVGSAVWHTETVSPGSGLAPELQVRADITIPERNITMTWTLSRNTDQALPASHTIAIKFTLPSDFPGGSIANVPGVLMKDSEQARGVPLAGLAVKVMNGYFLIGLSAVPADAQRNIDLLKTRPWFDIPIVYTNGGRAIMALEKGTPGDRAFADAFAAWSK